MFKCGACDSELVVSDPEIFKGDIIFKVDPCEKCNKIEYEAGYDI